MAFRHFQFSTTQEYMLELTPAVRRFYLFAEGDGDAGGGGGGDAGDGGSGDGDAGKGGEGDKGSQARAEADKGGDDDGKAKPVADWRDPLKDDADLHKFAERFPSPSDAVRAASDMRKKLSTALVQPTDDTSDEDRAAYHTKLGRPADAEGYDLAVPDDLPDHLKPTEADDATLTRFRDAMFAVNASADVAKAAVAFHYAELARSADTADTALDAYNVKADAQLKTEWGGDFDANIELGKRAFKTLPEGLQGRLVTIGFDADPEMKRFMATMGRNLGEDGMLDGGMPTNERSTLEGKLKDLEGSPNRWDKAVDTQITDLRKQLWPGQFNRNVA